MGESHTEQKARNLAHEQHTTHSTHMITLRHSWNVTVVCLSRHTQATPEHTGRAAAWGRWAAPPRPATGRPRGPALWPGAATERPAAPAPPPQRPPPAASVGMCGNGIGSAYHRPPKTEPKTIVVCDKYETSVMIRMM